MSTVSSLQFLVRNKFHVFLLFTQIYMIMKFIIKHWKQNEQNYVHINVIVSFRKSKVKNYYHQTYKYSHLLWKNRKWIFHKLENFLFSISNVNPYLYGWEKLWLLKYRKSLMTHNWANCFTTYIYKYVMRIKYMQGTHNYGIVIVCFLRPNENSWGKISKFNRNFWSETAVN